MDSTKAMEQFIIDLKLKLGIEVEQELPNMLSVASSLGNGCRIEALQRMNDDMERTQETELDREEVK